MNTLYKIRNILLKTIGFLIIILLLWFLYKLLSGNVDINMNIK
jgi:hypothetical protein